MASRQRKAAIVLMLIRGNRRSRCPRVSQDWLEQRRREDPLRYGREYECQFGSPEDSLFTPELLDRMVANDFEPLQL